MVAKVLKTKVNNENESQTLGCRFSRLWKCPGWNNTGANAFVFRTPLLGTNLFASSCIKIDQLRTMSTVLCLTILHQGVFSKVRRKQWKKFCGRRGLDPIQCATDRKEKSKRTRKDKQKARPCTCVGRVAAMAKSSFQKGSQVVARSPRRCTQVMIVLLVKAMFY